MFSLTEFYNVACDNNITICCYLGKLTDGEAPPDNKDSLVVYLYIIIVDNYQISMYNKCVIYN